MQVPNGWLQVLRAETMVTFYTQSGWRAAFRRATTSSSHEQASRAVAADAVGEIEMLKTTIATLGDSTAHANPLKEALRVVQPCASHPMESCKFFLECAKKHVCGTGTGC